MSDETELTRLQREAILARKALGLAIASGTKNIDADIINQRNKTRWALMDYEKVQGL